MRWPLNRFKKQSPAPSRRTIEAIYGTIVAQAREPTFYQAYGVQDSVNGRFDMVLLHLWMVLRQLRSGPDKALPQALFDHFCSDMDANLREMGVGDLSVPKRMKAFGEAFYGRSAAYDRALTEGLEPLARALDKNIYSGGNIESARRLAAYTADAIAALACGDSATPAEDLYSEDLRFPDLAQRGMKGQA